MRSAGLSSKLLFASVVIANLCLAGCATTGSSVGAGAGVGAALGATAGVLADPGEGGANRFRNIVIGSAIGGALGAGTGFMIDRQAKDEKQEAFEKGKQAGVQEQASRATSSSGNEPRMIPAKSEARWIGDQVHGSTFVPGHFEYVILENSHWETGK
jgi:hypothetical protein